MTQDKMSPLRAQLLEDMRIRGVGDKAQKSHIRAIKDFAKFLGHSPDAARPEEVRAYSRLNGFEQAPRACLETPSILAF